MTAPGRQLVSLADVEPVLRSCRVVAVLGCHPEAARPAHYVPAYLQSLGKKILPVNPRCRGEQLFGVEVVDTLHALDAQQGPVDVVNVFRRSHPATGSVGWP